MANKENSSPQGSNSPITLKSVTFGLLASMFISISFPYENLMIRSTRPANTSLPYGSVFIFFVLVAVVNPLLKRIRRRFALSSSELTIVFIMILISSAIPTWGLIAQLLPILPGAFYYASQENRWAELIHPYVPEWMAPRDPEGIRHFYEGLPTGGEIPWDIWIAPLLNWAILIGAFYLVTICLMVILRKQWVERERLIFPLMRLPIDMIEGTDKKDCFTPFFKNGLMWAGFIATFLISSLNGLHHYFHLVPSVNLRSGFGLLRNTVWLRAWVNFSVIAFTYLINSDVAFSLWSFCILSQLQKGIFAVFGFSLGPHEIYCAGPPSVSNQTMGAMIVLVFYGFWTARDHIKRMMKGATSKGDDEAEEVVSCRGAIWGLAIGLIVMIGWLYKSGLPLVAAALFLFSTFVTFIALTRSMVQGGVVVTRAGLIPQSFTIYTLGTDAIGPAGMASLGFAFSWTADIRVFLMPFFAHSLKLWDGLKTRARGFMLVVVLTIVVSAVCSVWIIFKLAYGHGGVNLSLWLFRGCPTVPFNYTVARMQSSIEPSLGRWLFIGIGATIMSALMFFQYRFSWWPLHPLGFAVGATQPVVDLWFSILLGWMFKVAILNLGGLRLYRRLTPLFLGLILGQFVACGLWVTVDAITGSTENLLYVY